MWLWMYEFLHTLPRWYWVVPYAWLTYGGLRWWTGEQFGRFKWSEGDESMPTALGLMMNGAVLLGSLLTWFGMKIDGQMFFEGYSRTVGFQMAGVGTTVFALRTVGEFLVPRVPVWFRTASAWCQKTYTTMQAKRASNPKHIIKQCQERLAIASRMRNAFTLPTNDDVKSMGNLAQASGNMLALLRDLFALVKNVDHLLKAVGLYETNFRIADAVFDKTELKEFAHLLGSRSADAKTLGELRHRVQGAIEVIVLRCLELPAHVESVSVDRQIEAIAGFQKYVGQDLVDMTEARDAVTDFETGRLHKRILAELDLGAGVSVTGPHTEAATSAPRARVKA